jgi:hypothetical protein
MPLAAPPVDGMVANHHRQTLPPHAIRNPGDLRSCGCQAADSATSGRALLHRSAGPGYDAPIEPPTLVLHTTYLWAWLTELVSFTMLLRCLLSFMNSHDTSFSHDQQPRRNGRTEESLHDATF